MFTTRLATATTLPLLFACTLSAQTTEDPFPEPIEAEEDVIEIGFEEFAAIPDVDGETSRMMTLVDEPGTERLFVSGQRGPVYTLSYDGETMTEYVDVDDPRWNVQVEYSGREQGVQSFAIHPQFNEPGSPGYGKFYTWTDTRNTDPTPDFDPDAGNDSHDTVLLEWTAQDPEADTYDGDAPRELMRFEQPYGNHNGGRIAFNPLATPGDDDFGLLFVGIGDGGSGGDPHDLSQDLSSGFGKIFRIDPQGSDSDNGEYGIPSDNPFAGDGDDGTLGEIYAWGARNPQTLAWDSDTGTMFVADIGQNIVEEVSPVTLGADLGWNDWEGSFEFVSRSGVRTDNPRGDDDVTYPVAEYDHQDPLVGPRAAVTGLHVSRGGAIPELDGLLLFGELRTGEIFYVDADDLPDGGQDEIRRVLLDDGGEAKTFLQLVQEKNDEQGRERADRTDLRITASDDGRIFLLNKHDGTIRRLVSSTAGS